MAAGTYHGLPLEGYTGGAGDRNCDPAGTGQHRRVNE